jgi:membrane associated rhomboid family serine protease
MTPEKKLRINKAIRGIVIGLALLSVVVMLLRDGKGAFGAIAITLGAFIIMNGILPLWMDDFFKKNWNEREYYPLLVIMVGVFVMYLVLRIPSTL